MALSVRELLFTSLHHRHLAIVGLAHAGGTVRQIAEDTGLGRTTVYRVLKSIGKAPGCGYGMRQFFIHGIEWDTDGRVIKRLPSSSTVLVDEKRLEDLDQEEAEYKAMNDLSDHHGYCIEGSHVVEVTPRGEWNPTARSPAS